MVRVKFQDNTYLGFKEDKPSKVTREQAHIYTSVEGAKTALKYVFSMRILKGYNTPTFVNLQDIALPEWQK